MNIAYARQWSLRYGSIIPHSYFGFPEPTVWGGFAKTVWGIKTAQEEWRIEMIRSLLSTKSNFRRERRARNAIYNGRSAFARAKFLNVTTAQNFRGKHAERGEEFRALVARHLNVEADGSG